MDISTAQQGDHVRISSELPRQLVADTDVTWLKRMGEFRSIVGLLRCRHDRLKPPIDTCMDP